MPLKDNTRKNKLEAKFEYGIWVGIAPRSGEFLLITPEGATRARNIKRLPPESKWDAEFMQQCKGTPWNHDPSEEVDEVIIPARAEPMPPVPDY